jgi:hypothetical protein
MDFLVARDDLHRTRFEDAGVPEPAAGQALLAVDAFGLSANNITYATFGEAMSYWSFFPAEDGWGRVPVWGFAQVSESRQEGLEAGARVYGYLPPSSELVVDATRVNERGFTDGAAHRSKLPPTYNNYARSDADPIYDAAHEDEQILLRPLFFTSYLIDDFLDDSDLFGARTVVLSSASSKTASALAFQLSRRKGVDVVGLTSPRSGEFARGLGVYDHVASYQEIGELPSLCLEGRVGGDGGGTGEGEVTAPGRDSRRERNDGNRVGRRRHLSGQRGCQRHEKQCDAHEGRLSI